MVFPVVMYGCESWTVKKAECRRIDAFELWCWRRPLRVPWTARRSNQSILKEISPGRSLEGMMLKLATSCEELTHWKRLWCWEETRGLLKLVHIEISHVSFSGESVLSTMTSLGWGTCQQGLWDPTGLKICYPERTQKDRKSEISYNPENLRHAIILSFGGYRI